MMRRCPTRVRPWSSNGPSSATTSNAGSREGTGGTRITAACLSLIGPVCVLGTPRRTIGSRRRRPAAAPSKAISLQICHPRTVTPDDPGSQGAKEGRSTCRDDRSADLPDDAAADRDASPGERDEDRGEHDGRDALAVPCEALEQADHGEDSGDEGKS